MESALKTTPRWRRWEFGPGEPPARLARFSVHQNHPHTSEPAPHGTQEGYYGTREISTAAGLFLALCIGGGLWVVLIRGAEWLGPVLFH